MIKFGLSLLFIFIFVSKVNCRDSDDTASGDSNMVPICDKRRGFVYSSCGSTNQATCDTGTERNHTNTTDCTAGCFCREGFVFENETMTCIPPQLCPRECPPGMIFNSCGPTKMRTCRNRNPQVADRWCVVGCFCAPGLVFSEISKRCIHPKWCDRDCPPGKVFDKCGPSCPPTCRYPNPPKDCLNACIPGCFCPRGSVFSTTLKECVLLDDCPKPCPPGKVRSTCMHSCPPTCDDPTPSGDCLKTCSIGCICKPGLVLSTATNSCIPINNCSYVDSTKDIKCPDRAQITTCGPSCPATCEDPNPEGECLKACVLGCVCNEGLVLDSTTNKCIPIEMCYKPCAEGMIYRDCGPSCLPTCDNPYPTGPCTKACIGTCDCENNFLYDSSTKTCVPQHMCPIECPTGMEFKYCACPAICQNPFSESHCKNQCLSSCVCKEGLLLDVLTGTCLEKEACPEGCPNGTVFSPCAPACPPTCDNPTPNCDAPCTPNCACETDFVFDNVTDTCIPKEKCFAEKQKCPEKMVFRPCDELCFGTCVSPKHRCNTTEKCTTGACVCDEEYLLDSISNRCVKREECPLKCPTGMTFNACAPACLPTCDDPNPDCSKPCSPNCVCDEDMLFDKDVGMCVPKENCTNHLTSCQEGMVFLPCDQTCFGTCDEPTQKCVNIEGCIDGACACREGLLLDEKSNTCIKRDACPLICPRGMVVNDCAPVCLPTCDDPKPECPNRECIAKCTCEKDLIFNEIAGTCIPETECAKYGVICADGMEFRPCNNACYDTCDTLVTKCVILPDCIDGTCVCREGLVLEEKSGKCKKREECPLVCPTGMTFHSCAPANLPTCEDPNPTFDNQCIPNCMCEENLLFDKVTGTCIPKSQCISEKVLCPTGMVFRPCNKACYASCDNIQPTCVSPLDCVDGACVCSEGLLLDEASGECVMIKECPNVCATGMVFDSCGYSCFPTCEDPNPVCAEPCYAGCKCEKGFVYDERKDSCVPRNTCPKPIFDCPSDMEPVPCDEVCFGTCELPRMKCYYLPGCTVGACICKKGLLLDVGTKTCVEKNNCPNICPSGMAFSFCASACPPTCDNPNPECNKPCVPSCSCNKGLVLNERTGKCVTHGSCTSTIARKLPTCLSDMEYQPCDKACHGTCDSPKAKCIDPLFCFEGACVCKEGLLLDTVSNTCVVKDACPKDCPSGMVFDSCATACPPTCDFPDLVCSGPCYPNCVCKKPLLLDQTTNTCVHVRNCPRPTEVRVCPDKMEFRGCDQICYATCSSPTKTCEIPENCADGACICNEGLLLDTQSGKCVEEINCPNVCPEGMHFEECAPRCPPTCDSPNSNCTEACTPDCTCDEGLLYDNTTDKCIPQENCTKSIPPCPDGMVFRSCNEVCYATCDIPIPHCVIPPKCTEGACVCSEGLLLHSQSETCVTKEDCNRKCPSGMTFQSCAPACRPTCDDPQPVCKQPCKPTCVCENGTIFNKATGKCVPVENCIVVRKTCPSEMEFHFCDNVCYGTCQSPTPKCMNPANCTDGECICKRGTLLDEVTGHCRKGEECVTCPIWSMKYRSCGLACPPTCSKPGPWDDCNNKCIEGGCFCPQGLILDEETDVCVPPQVCTKKCPPDMEYHPCNGIICIKTCRRPSNCFECGQRDGRCVCKGDLVLDETTNRCVPLNKCRIDSFERLLNP